MIKVKANKLAGYICCLLFSVAGSAQNNFAWEASVREVGESGFYKLPLTPEVVAKCRQGLQDIRIFDNDGRQVPYILKNDMPIYRSEYFVSFPVVAVQKEKDKQTHITLRNATKQRIDNLLLYIRNNNARRSFALSGSNDSLQWYIIRENIYLENLSDHESQTITQPISFPPNDYEFYQITIAGENVVPFEILQAGVYKGESVSGKFIEIPSPRLQQKDSADKNSYINVSFDEPYLMNKFIILTEGPKFFKRQFTFEKTNSFREEVLNGYLYSDSVNSFLADVKGNQYLLRIRNDDNEPLRITAIRGFQLYTYLLTYLERENGYSLQFGDSLASSPKYDLAAFADILDFNPKELSIGDIRQNNRNPIASSNSKASNIFLWTIIIAVLVTLIYFTFKMTKEINKKKDNTG